jgi:uncharacterized integral membrane protein (TIGR00698 family)
MKVGTETSGRAEGIGTIASAWDALTSKAPGAALCGVIALASTFLASSNGGPQFLYALFLGLVFSHLRHEPRTMRGVEFCAKTLLRFGVGLLGARITLDEVCGLGWSTAWIVIGGVLSTIALGIFVCRIFGLSRSQGLLSGGSVAICGASAALAISAVLPGGKNSERFTLVVVVAVTILSTIAMVAYPLVATALHLTPQLAGLFLGGTIHDVAQVIGAAYSLGQETGDIATVVKLFRVTLLTVVVMAVSASLKARRPTGSAKQGCARKGAPPLIPWFLWLFAAMAALHSTGVIPAGPLAALNDCSRICLVMAIAALGMKISFQDLAGAGWRPFALIVVETLWLAVFVGLCAVLRR